MELARFSVNFRLSSFYLRISGAGAESFQQFGQAVAI